MNRWGRSPPRRKWWHLWALSGKIGRDSKTFGVCKRSQSQTSSWWWLCSKESSGGDSGRPYIKGSYEGRDGWGSLSGFIERSKVPAQIKVLPVHPDFDARAKDLGFDNLESHRAAGDIIEAHADGSVSCIPNPQISSAERFELMRNWHLAHQRERERLAMVHHPNDEAGT